MSLRRIKVLYVVAVISIALILASTGLLGVITAVLMLTGALPMFRAVSDGTARRIIADAEYPPPDDDERP